MSSFVFKEEWKINNMLNNHLNKIILTALDDMKIPHYMDISDSENNVLYIDTGQKAKSNIRMVEAYTIDNNKVPAFNEIFCEIVIENEKFIVTLSEIIFACGIIRKLFY